MDITERLWTLSDAATYLHVAEKTVSRMIQRRELPAVRLGGQWRFVPDQLSQWLHDRTSQRDSLRDLLRVDPIAVPIDRLVRREHIFCAHPAQTQADVLTALADAVNTVYPGVDTGEYRAALQEREDLATTALGAGLAAPHIRRTEDNPPGSLELFMLITERPVPYGSGTCSVFCLVCTDDLVLHLRLIQKISYVLRNSSLAERLRSQPDADAVIATLLNGERTP
ncbi:MAG: PTS sugar transporter subunit IIA [Spirochaeta sp.]|jgi:excisionase family DNA binding protein|nr:PTS sugar transporter subunit IIA [Spirochaeta sp.]